MLEGNDFIDLAVIGQGEETILDIVKGLPFFEIKGIAYRSNENVAVSRPRELIANLDDIPFPAWHLLDLSEYPSIGYGAFNGILIDRIPRIGVALSRGCPFNCSYCSAQNV